MTTGETTSGGAPREDTNEAGGEEGRRYPSFPQKYGFTLQGWENFSEDFIEERRRGLQDFFDELLTGEEWHEHPVLLDFFNVHGQNEARLSVTGSVEESGIDYSRSLPASPVLIGQSPNNTVLDDEEDDAAYADTMNWVASVEEAGRTTPDMDGQRLSVTSDMHRRSIASDQWSIHSGGSRGSDPASRP